MTVLLDPPSGPVHHPVRPLAAATPAWWRSAAVGGLAVGAGAVLGCWVAQGGPADLGGSTGGALTALGRLLGLVAAFLLLVQVLLLARIPLLERSYGQDLLARVHRWVGAGSLTLLLLHVALVTLGYAVSDGRSPAAELWNLTVRYPGMLLAAVGTLLLVMVAATSVKRARRRLRYESWHLLHLYSYLGAGLVLPHQLWTGADFVQHALATAAWWTTWATTAALVLVYRVGLPLLRTLRHRVVVDAVVPEGPGIVSVHLRGRRLDRLPVRAGQFCLWRFLGVPGQSRAHPYSLSAMPDPDLLRVTVKDLGDDSAWVRELRPGTRVALEGPYGRFTSERRRGRRVLLLGCGVGVTPLRALAEELSSAPGDVVLLHRVRTTADALFADELDVLAARTGLRVVLLPGPRASEDSFLPGHGTGADVPALRRLVPDVSERDVYLCGPQAWSRAARRAVLAAGVPVDRLHEERFSW